MMKKQLLILALAIVCFSQAEAQLFVGGAVSFSKTGGSTENDNGTDDNPSVSSFAFSPYAGYFLNDKFAVGIGVGYGRTCTTEFDYLGSDEDKKSIGSTISIAPFARYYFASFNKFSLFAEGHLGFAFIKEKVKYDGETTDGPKTSTISFNVAPAISYAFSEKFELEANLNLFNLGYSHSVKKLEDNNDTKITSNNFGFGAGLNDITTLGNISISAIYRF
jgi:opacity protein-like surface antigen